MEKSKQDHSRAAGMVFINQESCGKNSLDHNTHFEVNTHTHTHYITCASHIHINSYIFWLLVHLPKQILTELRAPFLLERYLVQPTHRDVRVERYLGPALTR